MAYEAENNMSAAWPPAFLPSLHDPGINPESASRAELPRTVLKHLNPLGHEIKLWSASAAHLVSRLNRDRLPPELSTFLRTWIPSRVPEMPTAPFTVLLGESTHGWQIVTSSLPWLNDPAWTALLRLPALRSAWMSDLRASHLQHLLQLLPPAWVMDTTPIPPGAVIPGLEIASWPELIRLRGTGRDFQIGPTALSDPHTENHWHTTLTQALETKPSLCIEHFSSTSWILTRYHQRDPDLYLAEAWISTAHQVQQALNVVKLTRCEIKKS